MRLLLAALVLWGPQVTGGATVSGKITVAESARKPLVILKYIGPDRRHLKDPPSSPAVVYLEEAPRSVAEGKTIDIVQEGLQYRPRVVVVQAGTTVNFPNGDPCFHNVFSLSEGKGNSFDLGKYRPGESAGRSLTTPGYVEVRCKVHDHMRAYVHVVDSPYFAVTRDDGTFSIGHVPPGTYKLVVWKEEYGIYEYFRKQIEVTKEGAKVDLQLTLRDDRPADRNAPAGCCAAR